MTRGPAWLRPFALVLLVVAAYLPALSAGYVWDDDGHVADNATLLRPGGLRDIWLSPGATQQYYPMVFTSFWIEARLWGLNPRGYHAVNVLLHALVAVLLYFTLRELELPGAWWAAAVFALHPVHVESVAWISERKNVLSGVFYLAAALTYLRAQRVPSRASSAASFALFLAALLSKTVTCTLPAALVLVLFWKGGPVLRSLWRLAPWFAVGFALGLVTIWMEKHHIGASGESFDLSLVERCLVAGRAFWFYLAKLAWPSPLTFIYPRFHIDAGAAWQYAFPVAALATLAALWRLRSRIGLGPFTALAFFAVTLSPALGFVNVFPMRYSFVADHFQYLASIGPLALAVAALATGAPKALPGAGAAVLCVFGALGWNHARDFRTEETLWRDTIAKNETAEIAYTNLGTLLVNAGRAAEAEPLHRRAIELTPDSGDGYTNLGTALIRQGRTDEAIEQYRIALEKDPDHPNANFNLGVVLLERGDLDAAVVHLTRSKELDPKSLLPPLQLGIARMRQGRLPEAIAELRRSLELDASSAAAWFQLGNALLQDGRADEAARAYTQALDLDPGLAEARHNLRLATEQR